MPNDVPIPQWDQLPELTFLEKTAYIAYQLKVMADGTEAPVSHIFEPGLYIREIKIPAGIVMVGRPHIFGHRCELVSGSLLHVSEEGRRVIEAPFEMHTVPNYQLIVYTLTPIVGRTYHPNEDEERDVEVLENKWFLPPDPILQLGAMVHARLTEDSP